VTTRSPDRLQSKIIVASFIVSATSLFLAPPLMPEPYSWITHTISESAAQGVDGAWLARFGFTMFGLAVIWLATVERHRWGRLGSAVHGAFGVSMFAIALFSHRPFQEDVPFDVVEDTVHSAAATAVGFAFAFGVLAVALRLRHAGGGVRFRDVVALMASVVIPMGMTVWPELAGLLQRGMFLIAYVWYLSEASEQGHERKMNHPLPSIE